MRIYVVSRTNHHDDPYEGWHDTYLDSVWSTNNMAQERLTHLKDKWIKEKYHPEECERCPERHDDCRKCFYANIDDANPNHIICNEGHGFHTDFFIQERRIDVVDDEGQ